MKAAHTSSRQLPRVVPSTPGRERPGREAATGFRVALRIRSPNGDPWNLPRPSGRALRALRAQAVPTVLPELSAQTLALGGHSWLWRNP